MTFQPLWVILCHLQENGKTEIEEIVEEMKERERKERGTGTKKKTVEIQGTSTNDHLR